MGILLVALTRVKEGKKVFLKCFEESYITYNKKVEEKIAEMRKFKSYKFKKIYLMDPIYEDSSKEFKLGYFNIRGFMEGQHAEYLDNDKNLQNLDILVLSETWLTHDVPNKNVINTLNNWKILKRLDATDNIKHMGLMLLIPQKSAKSQSYLYSLDYLEGYSHLNKKLLYQGLEINLKTFYRKIMFVCVRRTPGKFETQELSERFHDYDCIMGDLNLNPKVEIQKQCLMKICGEDFIMSLQEPTTTSHNQVDHILLRKEMGKYCYATAYNNFASDHRSITLRISLSTNKFTKEMNEAISFDIDHH